MAKTKNIARESAKNDDREHELVRAIERYKWKRFGHIEWSVLSFARSTAYGLGMENMDSIKDALERNRVKAITSMLDKWIDSDNPTLQVAAMKMLASEEDRERLNQNQTKPQTTVNTQDRSEIVLPNGTKIKI